jgi:hypothetical protein
MTRQGTIRAALSVLLLLAVALAAAGCRAPRRERTMDVTAYCACGECNGYTRGHWWLLHLDFWNCVIDTGAHRGEPYSGLTASGESLWEYHPGLFSLDTLVHPYMAPMRLVFFPWLFLPHDGTLAADTDRYPFGTRMYVPGYGWGVVEDRGGAIRGLDRLDVFIRWHFRASDWGCQRVTVEIEDSDD